MSIFKTILLAVFLSSAALSFAQINGRASIEPCTCNFATDPEVIMMAPPAYRNRFRPLDKIDSSFKAECGYLVVPENREKKSSRMIKLPYIIVRSKNPEKHNDPVLFTAGGPGGSSLGWAVNSTRSVLIEDRDCIALEQRGTRYALPYLRSFELDDAIKDAYRRNGNKDSISIAYTKNELLDLIINKLYDDRARRRLPYVITQIMAGRHKTYMTEKFNSIFRSYGAPDGMRISVCCADQAAYHSEKVVKEIGNVYPYLPGYHINDVYQAMCDCWKSPPIRLNTRQGFYSPKPALLADGEMDPACRPLYVDRISHYMPNSQRFLFINKGHGVFGSKMMDIYRAFLNNPMKKIISTDPGIIGY